MRGGYITWSVVGLLFLFVSVNNSQVAAFLLGFVMVTDLLSRLFTWDLGNKPNTFDAPIVIDAVLYIALTAGLVFGGYITLAIVGGFCGVIDCGQRLSPRISDLVEDIKHRGGDDD
jgi:hypothetical protein